MCVAKAFGLWLLALRESAVPAYWLAGILPERLIALMRLVMPTSPCISLANSVMQRPIVIDRPLCRGVPLAEKYSLIEHSSTVLSRSWLALG